MWCMLLSDTVLIIFSTTEVASTFANKLVKSIAGIVPPILNCYAVQREVMARQSVSDRKISAEELRAFLIHRAVV